MQDGQLKPIPLLLAAVFAASAGSSWSQSPPAEPATQTITIHASQALPKNVQDLLVEIGEKKAIVIPPGAEPYAVLRTACGGSVTNEYLAHVERLNAGFLMSRNPAQRTLSTPPCIRMSKNEVVEVLPEDTAESFLQRSIGVAPKQVIQVCDPRIGKPKVFRSCYLPAVDALGALNGGKPLKPSDFAAGNKMFVPSVPLPTTITLKPGITSAGAVASIEAILPAAATAGVKKAIDVNQQAGLELIRPLSSDSAKVVGTPCDEAEEPKRPWPINAARVVATVERSVAKARERGLLRGPTPVRVADTGFLGLGTLFPDESFWVNKLEPAESNIDKDENRYRADRLGIDAANRGDISPYPDHEYRMHGTQVADSVLGGAPLRTAYDQIIKLVQVNFFKIYSKEPGAIAVREATFLEALRKIKNQAELRIVNYSVGTPDNNRMGLFEFMMQQVHQLDFLVVLAAGNDTADIGTNPTYPASYGGNGSAFSDWIITVGASAPDGSIAPLSNRSRTRGDLLAPGCRIPFKMPADPKKHFLHGTSFAAPLVSFTAAVLTSLGIDAMPLVKRRIVVSADFDPKLAGDTMHGGIVLNMERALSVFDDSLRLGGDETATDIVGTWQQPADGEIEVCKGELLDPRKLLSVSAYEEQSVTRLRVYYMEINNTVAQKPCEPAVGGIKLVDMSGKTHEVEWKSMAAFVPAYRFN
jgi:hypothetical protein